MIGVDKHLNILRNTLNQQTHTDSSYNLQIQYLSP